MSDEKSETRSFIEDAIAGGYAEGRADFIRRLPQYALCQIFLDPLAWQAVYKVRSCPGPCNGDVRNPACPICGGWGSNKNPRPHMHRFIDHLADGKTIDEALAAIR